MPRRDEEPLDLRLAVQRLNRLTGLQLTEIKRLINKQPKPPGQTLESPLYDKTRTFRPELINALDAVYAAHIPEYPAGALARADRTRDLDELRRFLGYTEQPPVPDLGSPQEGGHPIPAPPPDSGAAEPARRSRASTRTALVVAVVCLLAGAGWAWYNVRLNPVSGVVSCTSGADVTGVWVVWAEPMGWGSFAELSRGEEPDEWKFASRTPLFTSWRVRVGCGGTLERWDVVTVSPTLSSSPVDLVCDDVHRPAAEPGVCVLA